MQTTVQTRCGGVRGLLSEDGKTVIFRGIPYAAPPVGELRFRRPQPQTWEGELDCTAFRASCPQMDASSMDFYGKEFYDEPMPPIDEDGLHLNIWTPADAEENGGLPVLFWIHGGAFLNGFGAEKEFDGEGFARRNVILVTVNYRLNAFGFFTHPDLEEENEEHVSGNYGILDQIFALRWVRENIARFGGDPEKITIAGQSAGCMSVQTLISSPLTEGMFRGAILQSGGGIGGFSRGADKAGLEAVSQKLMEHLNVKTVAELRQVPWARLRDGAYAVMSGVGLAWSPHIDGYVLPGNTDELARSGKIHNIKYMIGSCGDDMADGLLQKAAAAFCENQLKLDRAPAYLYLFDRKLPGDDAGAFHSSELWYVFETLGRCWRPMEPHDFELARIVADYWANFVRSGDPNGPGVPLWEPWSPAEPEPAVLV